MQQGWEEGKDNQEQENIHIEVCQTNLDNQIVQI